MESEPTRRSIHLFDLDDTLMHTQARIWVRDAKGNRLKELAPSEFTVYTLKAGESFDFHEFSDLGILSRGIVVKYTRNIIENILKYGTQSHFGILTARAEKKLLAPFLIRLFNNLFQIRLAKEHIFAISDQRFSSYKDRNALAKVGITVPRFSSLSVAERKALVIAEDLVGRGFNDISFYDDNRENLNSFKVLREAYPAVVYKPHFIDPTWRARLTEFWDSGAESKTLQKGAASVRIILEHHLQATIDSEVYLQGLTQGRPILLNTFPLWLIFRSGKYLLSRSEH